MRVQFFGNIREVFREGFGLYYYWYPTRASFLYWHSLLFIEPSDLLHFRTLELTIINNYQLHYNLSPIPPLYTSHLSHLYLSSLTFNSSLPSYLLLTNYHLPFGLLREREREIQSLPVMGRDKNDEYTHTFRLDIEMLIYVKVEDIIFV